MPTPHEPPRPPHRRRTAWPGEQSGEQPAKAPPGTTREVSPTAPPPNGSLLSRFFRVERTAGNDVLVVLPFIHLLFDPSSKGSIASAILALAPHALFATYTLINLLSFLHGTVPGRTALAYLPFPILPGALVPLFVSGRNGTMIRAVSAGQLVSMALNRVLKETLRHPRPGGNPHNQKRYGMPSSHSQFLFWWAMAATAFAFEAADGFVAAFLPAAEPGSARVAAGWAVKTAVLVSTQAFAGLVAYSRLYICYHTPAQIYVGAGLGVALAASWWAAAEKVYGPDWGWEWAGPSGLVGTSFA